MIDITISVYSENHEIDIIVKGHAGFAKKGKDIVCAGVSALVEAAAQTIRNLKELQILDDDSVVECKSGNALIVCRCKNDITMGQITNILYSTLVGFRKLQESFPDYINLVYTGVNT